MHHVVRLNGGLGTQMFQYALGRALEARTGARVSYDLSFFTQAHGIHVQRAFELPVFGITVPEAGPALVRSAKHGGSAWRAGLAGIHPSLARERTFQEQVDFVFDPSVFAVHADTYFDGYWQSEQYFAPIADVLRQVFTFKRPLEPSAVGQAERIETSTAVSLHVRRGDYVTHAATNAYLATCGPEYYARAVAHVAERIVDAQFFIFSDDPAWARAHIQAPGTPVFIEGNVGDKSYVDMQLMSRCQHHIIANSSFSWWGAWLDPHPHKVVVAPTRWLRDPARSTPDLIPSTWTRL
jgi:hypothetical protein